MDGATAAASPGVSQDAFSEASTPTNAFVLVCSPYMPCRLRHRASQGHVADLHWAVYRWRGSPGAPGSDARRSLPGDEVRRVMIFWNTALIRLCYARSVIMSVLMRVIICGFS